MSETNRMEKLIDRLIEKTRKGEIAWSESIPSGAFMTSFPNYSVKIEASGSDFYPYAVKVLDQTGEIIARTHSGLSEALQDPDRGVSKESLRTLYDSARLSLYREDDLDRLLQEIG
jgi:hypothetical protein